MGTSSKGGRTYSDPSYGSIKQFEFSTLTTGTRGSALVQTWTPMNPVTILDWNISCHTLGTGGNQAFTLAATSSIATTALGTITMATNAIGAVVAGTCTETTIAAGGALHLYSVEGTGASLSITPIVSYREAFLITDN
jgi:hypothetical protein